tara:strand:- start:2749 stop:3657 length:909 start_codon:yes stop_codon:yes gene_type:complete
MLTNNYLNKILEIVFKNDKRHFKKLKENISNFDEQYFIDSNIFFTRYDNYLKKINKNFSFAVNAYLKMVKTMNYEHFEFLRSGKYSSSSFDEVNLNVYSNPKVMENLLHGLILSQFLWKQHYETFRYFCSNFTNILKPKNNYLEIGAGHGLYLSKVVDNFKKNLNYTVIDISQTSINFSKNFIANKSISYICEDIFYFKPKMNYDFITMGEVLEHVEDPVNLLKRVKNLLNKNGCLFITTPTNAPSIDHIYLFNNVEEIREMIYKCGFKILKENIVCSENASENKINQKKISEMYSAFLSNI